MSGPPKSRLLSWQPLGEYVERWLTAKLGEQPTVRQITDLLGVDRSAYYVWRKRGVTVDKADRICQKILEIHPDSIWQDEWRNLSDTHH